MKLIDLCKPFCIEMLINGSWSKEIPDDVKISIAGDGAASVTAMETGLTKIRFSYTVDSKMQDAYVYGDHWERGYGDIIWSKETRVLPWYCLYTDQETTCGYGVKVQPNALCYWKNEKELLTLTLDIRNGTQPLYLNGRELIMAQLVAASYCGDFHEAAHDFCKKMCDAPRLPKNPVYGGNDWYCNYGHNSYEMIMLHARRIAECAPDTENRPYMVIDDGWQLCVNQSHGAYEYYYNGGPWEANSRFGDMAKMAADITALGLHPGIWMRPLLTLESVQPEWVLKRDGLRQFLDPSRTEVLDIIRRDVSKIAGWGYKLIKHDFSTYDILGQWGYSMGEEPLNGEVVFADKTRTTAQIIKDMYQVIREAAGDDVVIIGCNTLSHLSAGVFELQRTGDDTSGVEWERTKRMGINTLALRMMQHNAFYAVDADCIGITGEIPWSTNKKWLDVLAKSGTPLFVSIGENAYTDEVKADIKAAFEKAAGVHKVSVPVDIIDNLTPAKWLSDFGIDEYDWE